MIQPVITLDLDWAPDFVVKPVIDVFIENQIKSTWFFTHKIPVLDNVLRRHKELFELGIHPNFMKNSTQGTSEKDVLDYCKELIPEAVSVRTHALVQNSKLLMTFAQDYSIKIDSSIFLPYARFLEPVAIQNQNSMLYRFPYYFGDHYYLSSEDLTFEFIDLPKITSPGLKIFTFHPIHLYLNTVNIAQYENAKKDAWDEKRLIKHRNPDKGIFSLFINMISYIKENNVQTKTLYDIYQEVIIDNE